ncbi:MAG: tamA [Gammaproteobacteria bacterium]|jgi:translocation and assembly module TamA|nr:tamA [Gammaproteobacteria bacterium]
MKKVGIVLILLFWCYSPSLWATSTENEENGLSLNYSVSGVEASDANANIKKVLDDAKKNLELTPTEINEFYRAGPEHIKRAVQPYGYFNPKIKSHMEHHGKKWDLHFDVHLGLPMPMEVVDIQLEGSGKNDPIFSPLLNDFPLKVGDTFTSASYQRAKQILFNFANNNGYPNASFSKQEVQIDFHHYSATIILHLNTGPRFYFGAINIAPNFFADVFLKRYAKFKPGDVYSSQKVLDYHQNLSSSHYFTQVLVNAKPNGTQDHYVPVNVEVQPVKKFLYLLGAGFGTDTGARGTLGFQWRRASPYGHYFNSNILVSQIGTTFTNTYFIPGPNPMTDLFHIGANLSMLTTAAGHSDIRSLNMGYTKKYTNWRHLYSLTFMQEEYKIAGQTTSFAQLLMPNANYYYVHTDNLHRPTYGFSWTINLRGAKQPLLTQNDFFQAEMNSVWILPLITGQNRLILRNDVGTTITKDFNQIPLSLRFLTGGAEAVRGYPFQSLGPGKYLFEGTAELQQRVYGDFYAGAFYDFGNAFNDLKQPALRTSAGPSLVWQSPVGNIALSLARTLKPQRETWSIQFSMGSLL